MEFLVCAKNKACKHIRSIHVGTTRQQPLVNSNGTQSSSQAPVMSIIKTQHTDTRERFKVVSLIQSNKQLLEQ